MTSATLGTAPLRLCPAPAFEPPYDDESAVGQPVGHPAGPLDVELPLDWGRVDPDASPRRRHRNRAGRRSAPAQQAIPAELAWTIRRFVDVYLEVLNDRRPLRHLRPLMTEETFHSTRDGLTSRGKNWWPRSTPRVGPHQARRTMVSPLHGSPMITLRKVRCCHPAPGVVEVAAVLRRGDQARAMGFRLEEIESGWVCTALEFVG